MKIAIIIITMFWGVLISLAFATGAQLVPGQGALIFVLWLVACFLRIWVMFHDAKHHRE